jgi:hypothetical protein
MVILFGFTRKRHPIAGFRMMCNACGGPSVQVGHVTRSAFTLFFIPLIPLGSGRELVCARCKTVTKAESFPWTEEVAPEKFHEEMMAANQLLAATMAARGGMPGYPSPYQAAYPVGPPVVMIPAGAVPAPAVPPPGAPPPPPPKVQCPKCKGEAALIQQYGRHYCRKCKAYA